MGKYFGTDGFRGEANVTLTADHAYQVGRFLGWYCGETKRRAGDAEPAGGGTPCPCRTGSISAARWIGPPGATAMWGISSPWGCSPSRARRWAWTVPTAAPG